MGEPVKNLQGIVADMGMEPWILLFYSTTVQAARHAVVNALPPVQVLMEFDAELILVLCSCPVYLVA